MVSMKVIFNHRKGKVEEMNIRFAKILQDLGRGSYSTRDMRPQPVGAEVKVDLSVEAEQEEQPVKRRGRPRKES